MGLLSSIGKAIKKVFSGVGKVFKKVGAFVGKIAGSKWGKALLLAAAVFTGGMALVSGWQAAGSATGFMGKFVAGAKGFMSAMVSPIETAKTMFGTAAPGVPQITAANQVSNAAAATELAASGGTAVASGAPTVMTPALNAGAAAGGTTVASGAPTVLAPTLTTGGAQTGNLLTRAATGAANFAKTPGGGAIIGTAAAGAISNYASAAAAEEEAKEERREEERLNEAWQDPARLANLTSAVGAGPGTEGGYRPLTQAENLRQALVFDGNRVAPNISYATG